MNETEDGKASPSKLVNPDGTTNWTVVFDDPSQGISVAVGATQSVPQLHTVMTNVALLLFKRKRDAGPRAEFLAMITDVIESAPEDEIEAIKAKVISILDAEKNLRIEKAALHAKNKLTQSIERRRDEQKGGLAGLLDNPVRLAAIVCGGFLVILFAALALYQINMGPSSGDQQHEAEPHQPAPAETPKVSKEPVENAPPKNKIVMLALKPLLVNINAGGSVRRLTLVPLIKIKEDDKITPICSLVPRINDNILVRVGALTEQGKELDKAQLSSVSAGVISDINARIKPLQISSMALIDSRKLPSKVVLQASRGCERVKLERIP